MPNYIPNGYIQYPAIAFDEQLEKLVTRLGDGSVRFVHASQSASPIESLVWDANGNIIAKDLNSFVNVQAQPFGAKGDGLADDTAAIQAALVAAAGRELLFPPGTYLHTGLTIAAPTIVRGFSTMAGTQSMLSYQGTGTGLTLTSNSIAMKNLVAFTLNGAVGIDHSNTLFHLFTNMYVLGHSTTQYKADNSYYNKWVGGTIQGKNGTGGTTRGIMSSVNFNANRIVRVRFLLGTNPADIWTAIDVNTGGGAGSSSGSSAESCTFDGGYSGGWAIRAHDGTTGFTITDPRQESTGQGFLIVEGNAFGIGVNGGSVAGASSVPTPRLFDLGGGDITIQGVSLVEALVGFFYQATARRVLEVNNTITNVVTRASSTSGLDGILSIYNGHVDLRGGYHTLSALVANPTAGEQDTQANIYVKAGKFVIQWNDGGTVRYTTIALNQATGVATVASDTSAP